MYLWVIPPHISAWRLLLAVFLMLRDDVLLTFLATPMLLRSHDNTVLVQMEPWFTGGIDLWHYVLTFMTSKKWILISHLIPWPLSYSDITRFSPSRFGLNDCGWQPIISWTGTNARPHRTFSVRLVKPDKSHTSATLLLFRLPYTSFMSLLHPAASVSTFL